MPKREAKRAKKEVSSTSEESDNDNDQLQHDECFDKGLRTTKTGRKFVPGRPIPMSIRQLILDMSQNGMATKVIAERLTLSTSVVKSILRRYREEGTLEPEPNNPPRVVTPEILEYIKAAQEKDPRIKATALHRRMVAEKIGGDRVPCRGSVAIYLRRFELEKKKKDDK